MELDLNGKVAMITGGSRGLGRRIAEALGREGCAISICARDEGQLNQSVAELAALGYKAQGTPADCYAGSRRPALSTTRRWAASAIPISWSTTWAAAAGRCCSKRPAWSSSARGWR